MLIQLFNNLIHYINYQSQNVIDLYKSNFLKITSFSLILVSIFFLEKVNN